MLGAIQQRFSCEQIWGRFTLAFWSRFSMSDQKRLLKEIIKSNVGEKSSQNAKCNRAQSAASISVLPCDSGRVPNPKLFFFFYACILWYYLSKPLTSLRLFYECGITRLQDVGHLRLRYCRLFNTFYNLNCSAWERAPWRKVTEKSGNP
jgi:hypothetical protein